ncbi:extracellular solute-binding protein [Opitutales bacterium ASA1]|uniref:ABC transporter substrate-binding protein n=1 Tax=Congregicoccus parvus TaxID=3081749 RepID=UPI002B2C679B|nr:extracellular solute-binding protein [Opitutales bacterium ASA1]
MIQKTIQLRGMTWDHARGYDPLVATARAYETKHPHVGIRWERRSLKAFEELPVSRLAAQFDLVVFDHPFVGTAARGGPFLPLDEHLPASYLAEQAANAVGASHESYRFAGHQWGLAIDAAAPVAAWRDDVFVALGASPPRTWEELLELAEDGRVEVPAAPIYCLMNFYSLCVAAGGTPFESTERLVEREAGADAIGRLRTLLAACDPGCLERNPIASHEKLSAAPHDGVAYCPLTYGYYNYARSGFATNVLTFGDPPDVSGHPLRTTLGGTGLGVSALRPNREEAIAYAAFVASGDVQRTIYTSSGGQPGHRRAWLDPKNNDLVGHAFVRTLPVLDRAYLRPRYDGYVGFQEEAGPVVHAAVRGELGDLEALVRLDEIFRASRARTTVFA